MIFIVGSATSRTALIAVSGLSKDSERVDEFVGERNIVEAGVVAGIEEADNPTGLSQVHGRDVARGVAPNYRKRCDKIPATRAPREGLGRRISWNVGSF